MRWVQAWMLLALATLGEATRPRNTSAAPALPEMMEPSLTRT
jgi:hypothetical protein